MQHDDELIQIFIEEAHDLLEAINSHLEQWQPDLSRIEHLAPVLRELHTLKGSARMMGFTAFSEYVHCLEQIIQKLHDKAIPAHQNSCKEIQHSIDYLNLYIDALAKSKPLDDTEIPLEQLKNSLNSLQVSSKVTEVEGAEEQDLIVAGKHIKHKNEQQAGSDNIRLKSEVLEKFGKLSREINIIRSHLEQQLGGANELLVDMTKEIKLIQEQMRQLQVKADINLRMFQSISSEKGHDEFDILEFDRYSSLQHTTRTLVDKLNYLEQLEESLINVTRSLEALVVEQGRAARSLEEGITHARMISIDSIVPRLKRIVRQVSHELGKEVHFECIKAQGEIDRKILERLVPGLEHMVRNAIDHGIEPPDIRLKAGKPAYGVITLSMFRQGNEIVIELGDDGYGIDIEKIKAKAVEKRLWDPKAAMSKADLMQIISLTGFSTKEIVTPISGRGVGMDVVNAEVSKLGGTLRLDTQQNIGTHFIIRLPFSLSLNQALILVAGSQSYAIPLSNLAGITRMPVQEINKSLYTGTGRVKYAGITYDLFYLAELLGEQKWDDNQIAAKLLPVIFLQSDSEQVAFVIDKLIGSREIMIKPAGSQLRLVKEIIGVSLLGEGQIVLVLNVQFLIQEALMKVRKAEKNQENVLCPIPSVLKQHKTRVLIVDDSLTVRKVTSRLLKRHVYDALSAKDGVEALEIMAQSLPDIVLLDIEMPIMDGFRVLEKMRKDPKYKTIPVIMITSRAGEKHRLRAMELGANAYLSKPYLEEDLLMLLKKYQSQS